MGVLEGMWGCSGQLALKWRQASPRVGMGSFFPQNIHEAIIIHMINREEHRGTVMSIVIMGFVQYLRDKGVCLFFFLGKSVYVCACLRKCVCVCVHASTCMQSAIDLMRKVRAEYP